MRQIYLVLEVCVILIIVNCQPFVAQKRIVHTKEESSKAQQVKSPPSGVWTKMLEGSGFFLSICFGDGQHGIATGIEEDFWLTSDKGISWEKHRIRTTREAQGGEYSLVKCAMPSSGVIHILGQLEEVGSAIFTTLDEGKSWTVKQYPNSSLNDITVADGRTWIAGTINDLPVVIYAEGQGAWRQIWSGDKGRSPLDVDFIDANTGWIVGASGLILQTTDGGYSWVAQQSLKKENLESVSFSSKSVGYAIGQHGVILQTTDGGNNWNEQNSNALVNLTDIVALNDYEAWAVGQNGTVLFTKDAGQHWQRQEIGTQADIYTVTVKDRSVWISTGKEVIFRPLE